MRAIVKIKLVSEDNGILINLININMKKIKVMVIYQMRYLEIVRLEYQ